MKLVFAILSLVCLIVLVLSSFYDKFHYYRTMSQPHDPKHEKVIMTITVGSGILTILFLFLCML